MLTADDYSTSQQYSNVHQKILNFYFPKAQKKNLGAPQPEKNLQFEHHYSYKAPI